MSGRHGTVRPLQCSAARAVLCLSACLLALVPACSALYSFDGFPLTTVSQGTVRGEVLTAATMGLADSPQTLSFTIPGNATVRWARTYAGVWGGTPRYTGWVQVTADGNAFPKTVLYGTDDKTPNVLCNSYGVYWTFWDTTPLLRPGENTVTVRTSQGEAGAKLDGRIYGVMTVAVLEEPGGAEVQYWIADGNVNLHSTGYTPGANPTTNDNTSVTFTVPGLPESSHANLTVTYLTSSHGEPDYLLFNGGEPGNASAGTADIADEVSYNDGYYAPVVSRYWDTEIFNVTGRAREGENTVTVLRGKDTNGDGEIDNLAGNIEGEDYLNPVFAMLTVEEGGSAPGTASSASTDLSVSRVTTENAFAGETATVNATVRNPGWIPDGPVTVVFRADGKEFASRQVAVDASGVQEISAAWAATEGTHTLSAEVLADGDRNPANNAASRDVTVGRLPDLAVAAGPPVRPGAASPTPASPLPAALALPASIAAALLAARRPERGARGLPCLMATFMVCAAAAIVLLPAAAADPGAGGAWSEITGPRFTLYYHEGRGTDARTVLSLMESTAGTRIERDLGLNVSGIPVAIATSPEEFRCMAAVPPDAPSGETVASVWNGTVVLYVPPGTTAACRGSPRVWQYSPENVIRSLTDPAEGYLSCINAKALVWGGTLAALRQGPERRGRYLPPFLESGMAHYEEYALTGGPGFSPSRFIPAYDRLREGAATGTPPPMTIGQLAERCGSYSANADFGALCQGEGTYAIWYLNERYGRDAMRRFLANFTESGTWETALSNVTGEGTGEFGDDLLASLRQQAPATAHRPVPPAV